MPATPPGTHASPLALAILRALALCLVAVAIAGSVLAVRILAGADAHAGDRHDEAAGPYTVAQDVPASFGFIAVEHAETLKGLTAAQLGGATHGIGDFVGRGQALVQASVTITNTGSEPLSYSPKQFRLATRSAKDRVKRVPLAHATVRDGELQPDAAIDARLSFVVPRNGSRLEVEFLDPDRAEPIRILLRNTAGRITAADRKALEESHASAEDADSSDHGDHGEGADDHGTHDHGAHDHGAGS